MVDELADALLAQGFSADRLHGGITQAQRTRVMNKFKNSEFEFLVATDVAARGIDVDDLEVVINYDLPHDPEDYVHRIGRTGRAGRKGMAATFVSGRDIYKIQYLEKFTHSRIRRGTIPTPSEVEGKRSEQMLEKVRALLTSGNYPDQMQFTDRLMEEGFQATEVCSALFSLLLGQGGGSDLPPAPKPVNLPNELEPHEGFAKPKGFKKQPYQGNGPAQGPRPGFKPGFKPKFEKEKPGKFAKGFKKDRGPRY
jgi:ATP-dependent RNA helicase DeaD